MLVGFRSLAAVALLGAFGCSSPTEIDCTSQLKGLSAQYSVEVVEVTAPKYRDVLWAAGDTGWFEVYFGTATTSHLVFPGLKEAVLRAKHDEEIVWPARASTDVGAGGDSGESDEHVSMVGYNLPTSDEDTITGGCILNETQVSLSEVRVLSSVGDATFEENAEGEKVATIDEDYHRLLELTVSIDTGDFEGCVGLPKQFALALLVELDADQLSEYWTNSCEVAK